MSEYGYHYVCDGNQSLSGRFEPGILRIIMDSYRKYVDMYGDRYSFNNPYTTNYFCSLLTSVAQDQFAYEVDENILKAMFAIFKEDHMIRELFTRWKVDDVNKCTIRSVILNGSIDDVYMLFYQQARKKHRHERCKFACGRIRHHISRIKRAIFHKK